MSNYYGNYNRGGGGGGNDRLPADPDRLQHNYVQQRPNLGRLDLGDLNEFAGDLVDALIVEIQNNAERNPLRTFCFNLWADRYFANRAFVGLLQTFAAFVEMICNTQNAHPQDVIPGEVESFVTWACARMTEEFPAVVEYLDPAMEREINESTRAWAQMVRDVQVWQRQTRGSGYGGGGGYGGGNQGRQGAGFNRGGLASAGAAGNYGNQGGYGNQGQRQVNVENLRPSWDQSDAPMRPSNQDPARYTGKPGFNSVNNGNRQDRPAPATTYERTAPAPAPAPAPQPQDQEIRRVDLNQKSSGVQKPVDAKPTTANPKRPYDNVRLPDGRELVPAFLSGWKVPYSSEMPPIVYDRTTHMLFHIRDLEGNVVEEIQEKFEEMEYLEHELNEKLKGMHRVNAGVFNKEIRTAEILLTRKLTPNQSGTVATLVSEEKRKELDAADAPRQLVRIFHASTLTEAQLMAKIEAARLDGDSPFLEYQVEEKTEYCIEPEALPNALALRRCHDYETFLTTLMDLHKDDKISDELFELIDKRMTVAFNRYNRKVLYLDWTVDSFAADYHDLLAMVKDKKGETIVRKFLKGSNDVIQRAMSVLTGDALTSWLKNLPGAEEDEKLQQPAVFCNRYSVTELPWTMFEMDSHWRLEGIVTKENARTFHAALEAIFNRTQTNGVHEHLLLTSDSRVIYAYRSAVMEGDFVITTEHPIDLTTFLTPVQG